MANVLITGGAGNLGRAVARNLVEDGNTVRIFDLASADFSFADGWDRINVAPGDIRNRADVEQACRGIDWVVHLAALIPPVSEERPDLARSVNVEGTRLLLEAMDSGACIVFASSTATYGVCRADVVTPDHPQDPIDVYGETKLLNEKDILAASRPAAILRISGIAVPALLEIPRPWFFAEDQRMEFAHIDDVATAVSRCVHKRETLGKILHIAGGASWRMKGRDYSRAICEAYEIPPEAASFLDEPNWPAWYDTEFSQGLLAYQNHTFDEFIASIRSLYLEAIG